MPAAFRVSNNDGLPLYAWVEAEVVRLGSAAECEVCIEGVDPHAATVVFRDGAFYIVNRSRRPLTLGGKPVASGSERPWTNNAELVLAPGISIGLVRHRNPAPVAPESWRIMPDVDAPEKERFAQQQRFKQVACFAITAAALFLTGVLLVQQGAATPDRSYRRVLASLVGAASEAGDPRTAQNFSDALGWVQAAHSSEQRGDADSARLRYLAVRDLVLGDGSALDAARRHLLLQYIAERLEAI